MRLFTTRARRPDRVPEIHPLDLSAVAAARRTRSVPSPVPFGVDRPGIAAELSRISGVRLESVEPADVRGQEAGSVEVSISGVATNRSVSLRLDRPTRRAWLGLILGCPGGPIEDVDLPESPTPLERSLLERTLVLPVARAIRGGVARSADAGHAVAEGELPLVWTDLDTESEPESRESSEPRSVSASTARIETVNETVILVASTPSGDFSIRLSLRLTTSKDAEPARNLDSLDSMVLSAVLPLTVRLDSSRAGLAIRAGDLARFAPGDILVTDLAADSPGGLPIELLGPLPTGVEPRSGVIRGRLGQSGSRRAARIAPVSAALSAEFEPARSSDH